jgi:regulator of replication initiation timing
MKQHLRSLLANGNTRQVIDQLLQATQQLPDLHNEVVQISARFAQMERQNRLGTEAHDTLTIERNKINAALLEIIGQLPDETTKTNTPEKPEGKTIIQNADKIYNIGHIDKADFS